MTAQIAILMATYNGERFLGEQLESFANQTEKDWVLWVSDDGSTDNTKLILQNFSARFSAGKVNIVDGPKKGFANNFLSLINNPLIKAKNYAYSDQDDVWCDDKLSRALNYLSSSSVQTPALYCSRTEYVNEGLTHIGYSSNYQRPATFLNAIVQNIASGNTMVFNEKARELLIQSCVDIEVPLHDWWTYIVVTACGGQVFFDKEPSVRYRQHEGNLWGMNTGLLNRLVRVQKLFGGRFSAWNKVHANALTAFNQSLTLENREIVERFRCIRSSSLLMRLYSLRATGVYRQTLLDNIGMWLAAIFNKV